MNDLTPSLRTGISFHFVSSGRRVSDKKIG
jgi:hypothetical protein